MPSFDVGDTWEPQVQITDNGAASDPATLTFTVRSPSGAITTAVYPDVSIVKDAVGLYRAIVAVDEAGVWAAQFATTDPEQVQGLRAVVRPGPLDRRPRSLSLEELKRRLDKTMDVDDDLLLEDLASAFAQAQAPPPNGTGRLLTPNPDSPLAAPVQLPAIRTRRRLVRVPDAQEITEVLVDDVAVDPADYETISRDGYIVRIEIPRDEQAWDSDPWRSHPHRRRQRVVKVTGRFGFTTIPEELAGAIYVLAARYFYERQAQYADQVAILEGTAVQAYYRQLPPRVKLVFNTYAVPTATGLS